MVHTYRNYIPSIKLSIKNDIINREKYYMHPCVAFVCWQTDSSSEFQ